MEDTLDPRPQRHQETAIGVFVTGMTTGLCALLLLVGHPGVCDQETGAAIGTRVDTEVDHELLLVDIEAHLHGVTRMMNWVSLVGRRMRYPIFRYWSSMKESLGMYLCKYQ